MIEKTHEQLCRYRSRAAIYSNMPVFFFFFLLCYSPFLFPTLSFSNSTKPNFLCFLISQERKKGGPGIEKRVGEKSRAFLPSQKPVSHRLISPLCPQPLLSLLSITTTESSFWVGQILFSEADDASASGPRSLLINLTKGSHNAHL